MRCVACPDLISEDECESREVQIPKKGDAGNEWEYDDSMRLGVALWTFRFVRVIIYSAEYMICYVLARDEEELGSVEARGLSRGPRGSLGCLFCLFCLFYSVVWVHE